MPSYLEKEALGHKASVVDVSDTDVTIRPSQIERLKRKETLSP